MIKAFFRFTRIEHTVFSLPLLFAGAYLAAGRQMPPIRVILLIGMAGTGARILGMSMNRIFDRNLDAANPRTAGRELVTGKLSLHAALGIAGSGLAVYLLACGLLNPLVLLLSPVPAIVLIGYSLLKRFTPLCHFGIGLSLALAPCGAYLATKGTFGLDGELLLLALFTFFWMSGFDIIYALQDVASDTQNRVYSLPAVLGERRSLIVAGCCHVLALGALCGLVWNTGHRVLAVLPLAGAVASFTYAYLPHVPMPARFFPTSAIAGICGALIVFL